MQQVKTIPIMFESQFVGGSSATPTVLRLWRSSSYKTNTLPTGGTFKPGNFKITAGRHSSTSVSPGKSGEAIAKYTSGSRSWIYTWTGPLCPPMALTDVTSDCVIGNYNRLRDLALTKAFAKIGKPSNELGVELGELSETLSMLRNPLKGLRHFLSKDNEYWSRALAQVIKHRKFPTRHLKLTGKTVSETWLEIRYGIMPFIRSIQELVELSLDRTAVDFNKITTVGGTERDVVVRSISQTNQSFSTNPTVVLNTTGMRVTSVEVRAKVYFRRKHALSVSRQLGLDIVNVPEIMWQLTTCSFILDWFTNVGQFIASWRYTPEIQVLGATVSYRFSARATLAYDWNNPTRMFASWIKKPDPSSTLGISEIYERTIVDARPPGTPRFLVTSKLSIPKTIDLILIATQRLLPLLHRKH